MHKSGPGTRKPARSRTSTVNESPPPKRLRATFDDNFDTNDAANGSIRASVMTPSSLSQGSGYDQVLMDVEAQSEAQPNSIAAGDTATPGNPIKGTLPMHKLLDSTITIVYGKELHKECSVHLQLLSDLSPKLRQQFYQAANLRENYSEVKSLRQKVKALLPPETNTEVFLHKDRVDEMVARAMPLITRAYSKFPLLEYQTAIKKALEATTDEQFQDSKLWKVPPSSGGLKRADYPSSVIVPRLKLMKPEAVLAVLSRLYRALRKIKAQEEDKASRDSIKAAAQRRVILPYVDEDIVGSLLHWIYNNELHFLDAAHLCNICEMAERLGLQELTDSCLAKLSSAASAALEHAGAANIPLRDLLEEIQTAVDSGTEAARDPLSGVVRIVFTFVLRQKCPPAILKHLVIEAVANSADPSVVDTSLRMMTGEMKDQLCMALSHRLSKLNNITLKRKRGHNSDASSGASVKSENPNNLDAEMKEAGNNPSNDIPTDVVATPGNDAGEHFDQEHLQF